MRVLEQAPEFREIGAGIQLGPNIFRALERLGLKDAVLADAHRPPAMEMRCALSGERVTRIPLDDPRFREKFKQPYAVTHRHDSTPSSSTPARATTSSRWRPIARVEDFEQDDDRRHADPAVRRAHPRPRAHRLRRHVVEGARQGRRRRQAAGVGPHRLSRRAQARGGADGSLEPGRDPVGGSAHPSRALPAAPRRALQPGRRVPFQALRRGLERGGRCRRSVGAFQGPASRGPAHARAHRDLAHVGAVRPRAGEGLDARGA